MIEFAGVVKHYPGSPEVLKNLSFSIAAGEFVYLTGHSGAGKSTVMRLIAAIEKPTAGVVLVHHQNVGQLSRRSVPFLRRQLGMVLQDHRLLFDRTVLENVLVPLQIAGMDRREATRRARARWTRSGCGAVKNPTRSRFPAASSSASASPAPWSTGRPC